MSYEGQGAAFNDQKYWDGERWALTNGSAGCHIKNYLPRTGGNMRNAVAMALTENPSERRFVFPSGDFVWTATLRPVDGLRDDLCFEGHNTNLRRLDGSGVQMFFQYTITTEKFSRNIFRGITFTNEDPLAVMWVTYAYNVDRFVFDSCNFRVPTITPGSSDGTRLAVGASGAFNSAFVNCYFERAQATFCGLGQSAKNCIFANNRGVDCTDFLFSCVGGGLGDSSDFIRDILVTGNTMEGCIGSGMIFVGTDGVVAPLGVIDGITVTNNVCRGNLSATYPGAIGIPIRAFSGFSTRHLRIAGNSMRLDGGISGGIGGIYFAAPSPACTFDDCRIEDNDMDFRGVTPGLVLEGIDIPYLTGNGLFIRRNVIRGGRGIHVMDTDHLVLDDNEVRGGRVAIYAQTRNVSYVRLRRNLIKTEGAPFTSGLHFGSVAPGFNFSDVILEDNDIGSDTGQPLVTALIGGTMSMQLLNNPRLSGFTPGAETRAGITRALNNPDFT